MITSLDQCMYVQIISLSLEFRQYWKISNWQHPVSVNFTSFRMILLFFDFSASELAVFSYIILCHLDAQVVLSRSIIINVMASCSIHLEHVLIPGKLMVLWLSGVYCRLRKASWVFSGSYSSRFSFNPSAIDILFTSLTKFSSFVYYLCYCLIGYLSEHSLLDGSFDL